ncbi:DUF397 domain-containing protein [Actinokineospora globicatena]|uniref:DUF397 domain-containing protein n=1 Tax=Actinokineospora globicatena TaxID=103729 RepID=UPI0020A2B3C1|nr:DUF397 domain-containing protein [Actinokineospora globicatena]MCP2302749.1 protein of unknown function (DUF397) [Actinokineospora globicatena]GLW75561.1 hypothetical protein Aglo01_00430 [Actinokineospora globicatena]GLW82401.1 hypothetical protein Aglo02_00420 [Actinokineospora globicatena]
MRQTSPRFKKSSKSGGNSNCVEVGSTLAHLRDSKNPQGPCLAADAAALIRFAKAR